MILPLPINLFSLSKIITLSLGKTTSDLNIEYQCLPCSEPQSRKLVVWCGAQLSKLMIDSLTEAGGKGKLGPISHHTGVPWGRASSALRLWYDKWQLWSSAREPADRGVIVHLAITCISFSILLCAERKTEAPVRVEGHIKRAAQADFPIQTKAESSSQKWLHSTPFCWNMKCLNEVHTWLCLIPLWCWRQRLSDGSQEVVHPKWPSAWKCTVDKSSFSQNFSTKT